MRRRKEHSNPKRAAAPPSGSISQGEIDGRLRIAVVGQFEPWPWGQRPDESYLADALEKQGVEVLRLDQALLVHPLPVMDWALFTSSPASYLKLPQWSGVCKTLLWTLDWLPDYAVRRPIIEVGRTASLFVSSDRFDWRVHFGIRHHVYLPGACETIKSAFSPKPKRSCAFLGSLYNSRRRRIAEVVRNHGGEVREREEEWVYGTELAKYVQDTKVILGDSARNDVPGYWSTRNYVIPGAGGFLLTPRAPGLAEQFGINKHLAVYESVDDLEESLVHWMDHDADRESIRRHGYRHVKKHHSWDARAGFLHRILREHADTHERKRPGLDMENPKIGHSRSTTSRPKTPSERWTQDGRLPGGSAAKLK